MANTPTHPLPLVPRLAGTFGARLITVTAERSAFDELGMNREEVFGVVRALDIGDFHKTMRSEQDSSCFQDVYRPKVQCPRFPRGVQVYCKVQVRALAVLVVVSFKLR